MSSLPPNNCGADGVWFPAARRCPSPNFNARPAAGDIRLLVIHNISLPAGEFGNGNIEALFQNNLDCAAHPSFESLRGLEVSAHALIRREGEVVQFVAFDERAWHAGKSSFNGEENCNDFSIGIELEGCDDLPYTDAQYRSLQELTAYLFEHYPELNSERLVGHSDIAPGRKTDPGPAFDWHRYRQGLEQVDKL